MSTIGSRIAALRQRDGISQERLADLLSTGRSTVIRYETGKTYPNSEIIVRLCGVFRVSADYLLGLTDERPEGRSAEDPAAAGEAPKRRAPSDPPPPAASGMTEEIRAYIDEAVEAAVARRCPSPCSEGALRFSSPEEMQTYIDRAVEAAVARYSKK